MNREQPKASPNSLWVLGDEYDDLRVWAVMLAPKDAGFQRSFFAVNYVRRNQWEPPGAPIQVDRQLLSDLMDAPSYAQIIDQVQARTKDASVAGYVLICLFMMWRFPDLLGARSLGGPSLRKAFHACVYFAQELEWTFKDGTPLPSLTKVKECWGKYGAVAHLWAAHTWNKVFPVGDQRFLLRQHLPEFLSGARYFEMFGLEPVVESWAGKKKISALQQDGLWRLPNEIRALLPYADDPAVYADSPLAKALRTYVAEN